MLAAAQKSVNERIAEHGESLARVGLRRAGAARPGRSARGRRDGAAEASPRGSPRRPVTLGVGEPLTATLIVAGYAALLLTLPLLLYQLYAFVLPAFSPTERQVAVPLMVLVPFLFYAGVVFAYYLVLPAAVDFLQNFNDDSFDILLQARDYYRFAILVLAVMGLLFQLPMLILAVTRMGILTPAQLRKHRRYAILIIADPRRAAAGRRPRDDAADDVPDPGPVRGLYPSRLAARPACRAGPCRRGGSRRRHRRRAHPHRPDD